MLVEKELSNLNYIIVELITAFGKMFLNPLIYWIIFISFLISKRRTKDEQIQFNRELFPIGAEYYQTGKIMIISSILISAITFFLNTTFVNEIIIFLSIIIFILSFAFGFKLLSAAYSLGFTFLLFKVLELYNNDLFASGQITTHTFSSIALLIGLFLFVEVALYKVITNENAFPEILKSKRGSWFGMHHIQKATFIPFLVFIPGKITIASLPIVPYFTLGSENISFMFIPFVLGFHHIVKGELPEVSVKKLRHYNFILAGLVVIGALISFYLPGVAIGAVLLAIVGKIYINGLIEKEDAEKEMKFVALNNQLCIFAIAPKSPADILGLKVGDTITKVNNIEVHSFADLKEELASLIVFPSFEVITSNHEVRQIENTSYKGNLTELGIIFPLINHDETT